MNSGQQASRALISEMRSLFGRDGGAAGQEVPKPKVLDWMRVTDLEARGALYSLITNSECASRISPPLEFDDYYSFVLNYLEQCIEEGPDSEWTDSRYLAGHQLVAWVVDFWKNEAVPREKLAAIKGRLAALYKRGDEDVRDAVVNGVLEHLFEHRSLARYFKDWESDPVLAGAYRDSLLSPGKG